MIPITIDGKPFEIQFSVIPVGQGVDLVYVGGIKEKNAGGATIDDDDTKDEESMIKWLKERFLVNVSRMLPEIVGVEDPKTASDKIRIFMEQLISEGRLVGEGKKLVLKD